MNSHASMHAFGFFTVYINKGEVLLGFRRSKRILENKMLDILLVFKN